jgi:hypothetical protein
MHELTVGRLIFACGIQLTFQTLGYVIPAIKITSSSGGRNQEASIQGAIAALRFIHTIATVYDTHRSLREETPTMARRHTVLLRLASD